MGSHLKILVLSGVLALQFVDIVPENVPALSDMKLHHLLQVDLIQLGELGCIVPATLHDGQHGSVVHEVAGVDCDIRAVDQVHAGLVSADGAEC